MKILDTIISKIAILLLIAISLILLVLPFNIISLDSGINLVKDSTSSNYIYSLIGGLLLLLAIKALFSGISKASNRQNHIVSPMNFGDLRISDQAIEGIAQNVITRIIGIRSSKIMVDFNEGFISILVKGQVAPDINIPSVTGEIQTGIKNAIEANTGIQVSRVNVDIQSISSPIKSLK